jgi:hypothetical protein
MSKVNRAGLNSSLSHSVGTSGSYSLSYKEKYYGWPSCFITGYFGVFQRASVQLGFSYKYV